MGVEFRWADDRYQHTIYAVAGKRKLPLLTSVAGNDGPVFSELHAQGETLLLTGATTAGHWSLSVEGGEQLVFEAACRCKSRVALASEYRLADCELDQQGPQLRLTAAGVAVSCETNGDWEDAGRSILRIRAAGEEPPQWPATRQWRYALQVSK